MDLRDVSLGDRFDLSKTTILLSGVQALARVCLMQQARDAAAGHDTAGYVTGYRGSPVGAVDQTFRRAGKALEKHNILFQEGLNEDLAATALWGTQQAHLRGEGRHDGVFGMWYGKGPGVDRSGDVFRHANLAGTAPLGGVIAVMGDDHTCESSTTCHQSELAMIDAMTPILSPAGVQEVLDYGLHGWALSRYCGLWVGLKCVKDTVEVVEVVDGSLDRVSICAPKDFEMPEGGLNIRFEDTVLGPRHMEARLHDHKRQAAQAYARANGLDRRTHGAPGARIGIVSSGKAWLDVVHALDLMGIDEARAEAMGLSVFKVGMVWPLEPSAIRAFAEGTDLLIVVEEKRAVIETQLKEILYNAPARPRVVGWKDEAGAVLFPVKMALDPVEVAAALGRVLEAEGAVDDALGGRLAALRAAAADEPPALAARRPWFCAGCPHNSSTRVPEGSRAYAGIGCHYMAQWMDRSTEGYTHMGGEGANWIGEAPFSKRAHVFQNIGDGTYNHSGVQAIRAALAASVNITYKVLYNDAVAMTGGQKNDGGLDAYRIAAELRAMGVREVVAVYDPKEAFEPERLPPGVRAETRDRLDAVQRELAQVEGVTAIVYVQTCAAEKRRRRKRGQFPDIDSRIFINPLVCEGCGDCGVQSNCVAILPKETPFGRKREIDQSACNKDFSCVKGFCPSFVTLHGAKPKAADKQALTIPDLPEPALPAIEGTHNTVITGIGGTGVVTVGALLSMAAHLEGKGAGEMQMAGLAQKGGAVLIHVRIAESPAAISAIRVSSGEADAVIGGDLVVAGGAKTLAAMARGRTRVVCNSRETTTGDFALDGAFSLPFERLRRAVEGRVGAEAVTWFDATSLAEKLLGDAIYANVLMLGGAWQTGLVPLSRTAILRAIELNGAGVEGNRRAFEIGRWAAHDPAAAAALLADAAPEVDETLDAVIARRAAFLRDYQSARWARRYETAVAAARAAEARAAPGAEAYADAVARSLFKLMSYKDEYEVARLHAETLESAVAERFDGVERMEFHLAPPLFAKKGPDGTPLKSTFGPGMMRAFRLLARLKGLRGTPLDPFGWTAERRGERAAIKDFLAEIERLNARLSPETHALAVEIAALPQSVKGFGHVKAKAAAAVAAQRAQLWAALEAGPAPAAQAAE